MSIQLTKEQMADYLISDRLDRLVLMLMNDGGLSLEEAMDKVYTSRTVRLLQIPEGELYVQSPSYVYELLERELSGASMTLSHHP